MKRFLSWDCANKSLAWSHMTIDTGIFSKIRLIVNDMRGFLSSIDESFATSFSSMTLSKEQLQKFGLKLHDQEFLQSFMMFINTINYFLDNFITFHSCGVRDILNGKLVSETDEIQRTKALHDFLITSLVSEQALAAIDADGICTQVIIEHQPSKIGTKTNNKSTAVGHQLMFYYITRNPVLIHPKLKNEITLCEDLEYEKFYLAAMIKNKSRKDAIYSARKLHSKSSLLYLCKIFHTEHIVIGISKSCLDDLADSVMQVLAYLYENKLYK